MHFGREGLGVAICEKYMYNLETETREYPASEFTSRRLLSSISRTLRRHLNDWLWGCVARRPGRIKIAIKQTLQRLKR